MTTPTPEQIAACMEEALQCLRCPEREGWGDAAVAKAIATALATRDADHAVTRERHRLAWEALCDIGERVTAAGHYVLTPERALRVGEAVAKLIEERDGLRADLATAHRERDEARRALAECTILSGDDTDGNTIENGGWVHLWPHAVDAVRQLRADYDEALDATPTPAPAFRVGDRVTAENVGDLPVGTEIRDHDFPGWSASKRKSGNWHSAGGLRWEQDDICTSNAYIHSLPTPEKP